MYLSILFACSCKVLVQVTNSPLIDTIKLIIVANSSEVNSIIGSYHRGGILKSGSKWQGSTSISNSRSDKHISSQASEDKEVDRERL